MPVRFQHDQNFNMAYEIVKRLEEKKENKLLDLLYDGVKKREQKKGHPDSHRDIKYLKTALMPKNVIVKNSFFKNLITFITIL